MKVYLGSCPIQSSSVISASAMTAVYPTSFVTKARPIYLQRMMKCNYLVCKQEKARNPEYSVQERNRVGIKLWKIKILFWIYHAELHYPFRTLSKAFLPHDN